MRRAVAGATRLTVTARSLRASAIPAYEHGSCSANATTSDFHTTSGACSKSAPAWSGCQVLHSDICMNARPDISLTPSSQAL